MLVLFSVEQRHLFSSNVVLPPLRVARVNQIYVSSIPETKKITNPASFLSSLPFFTRHGLLSSLFSRVAFLFFPYHASRVSILLPSPIIGYSVVIKYLTD